MKDNKMMLTYTQWKVYKFPDGTIKEINIDENEDLPSDVDATLLKMYFHAKLEEVVDGMV